MLFATAATALAALILAGAGADGKMLLDGASPKGFNTFDSYPMTSLNDSSVHALADSLAKDLLPSGYDYFVIDGGWTTSKVTFENGSSMMKQNLDAYGRPIPAPERYPDGMKALADAVHAKGLKLGLWTIRGAHMDAVAQKLPIKGTSYTIDQIIDTHSKPGAGMSAPPGTGGANMSCLWAAEWLGVNTSHPAAQAYYDSRVELLVGARTHVHTHTFHFQGCI